MSPSVQLHGRERMPSGNIRDIEINYCAFVKLQKKTLCKDMHHLVACEKHNQPNPLYLVVVFEKVSNCV